MSSRWKLVGVVPGLVSVGVYFWIVAYDTVTEIVVVLGSAIAIAFFLSAAGAVTRAGPLAGPALVLLAYAASLVWVANWVHSCPDCYSDELARRDGGVIMALLFGVVFLMSMGTAVAGSVAGLWLKRANPPADPSG